MTDRGAWMYVLLTKFRPYRTVYRRYRWIYEDLTCNHCHENRACVYVDFVGFSTIESYLNCESCFLLKTTQPDWGVPVTKQELLELTHFGFNLK